jgi:hypothetical protein
MFIVRVCSPLNPHIQRKCIISTGNSPLKIVLNNLFRKKPRDLIQNGFFYTGIGDRVPCSYCNVTIKQWDRNVVSKQNIWNGNQIICLLKWFPAKFRFSMLLGIECFLLSNEVFSAAILQTVRHIASRCWSYNCSTSEILPLYKRMCLSFR